MSRPKPSDAGFGLVEAIVALAIASLALTALYRSLAGAFRAADRVQVHESALALARSHLDSLGSDGVLQAGKFSGSYANGLQWRLNISVLAARTSRLGGADRPYWLVLEVFDRGGAVLLELETAKMAGEAP